MMSEKCLNIYGVCVCRHGVLLLLIMLSDLAEGHCSPQYTRPAAEVPAAQIFSLYSCTWQTYTDSPTRPIQKEILLT